MTRACPRCGLINPDTAARCDCGCVLDERVLPTSRGAIIRRSVELYRDNFLPLAFLGGLFWVPTFFGTVLPYIEERHYLVVYGLAYLVTILASTFVSSMCLVRAASALIRDQDLSLSIILGEVGWRSFFRFVWTGLLGLLTIAVGTLALVIPGIFLALRFALAGVVAVVEERGGRRALARSWVLLRGRTHEVLVLWVLLLLPTLASSVVSYVLKRSSWGAPLGGLIELLTGTFWSPVWWIAMTVLYWDLAAEESQRAAR